MDKKVPSKNLTELIDVIQLLCEDIHVKHCE